jgi:hypothetical protein
MNIVLFGANMKKQKPKWYYEDDCPYKVGIQYIMCYGNAADRRKAKREAGRYSPGKEIRVYDEFYC